MSNKIIHKRSSVVTENGMPKIPTPDQLEYGEIAINYAAGKETLSIKNTDNEILSLPFKKVIVDQALSDVSTNAVSNKVVSTAIEGIEDAVANKQDTISDLANIRQGAQLGATALQGVPAEYAKITDVETMINNAITVALNTEV